MLHHACFLLGHVPTDSMYSTHAGFRQLRCHKFECECRLAHEDQWRERHGIYLGTGKEYPGDYSTWLLRANFSLVMVRTVIVTAATSSSAIST